MMNRLTGFSKTVHAYQQKVGSVMREVRAIQSEREEIMHHGMKILGLKKDVVSDMLTKVTVKEAPATDTGESPVATDDASTDQGNLPMQEVTMLQGTANIEADNSGPGDSVAIGNVQNAAEAAE